MNASSVALQPLSLVFTPVRAQTLLVARDVVDGCGAGGSKQ